MTTFNLEDARQVLDSQGFVHIPGVLSAEEVASLQDRVSNIFETRVEKKSGQVLYVDGNVPEDTPHLDRIIHTWLDPHRYPEEQSTSSFMSSPSRWARELLGATPNLLQDILLIKEPGQETFPWHQDFPFWPIDQPDGLTCWIPLIQAGEREGGLHFAKGSHRLGSQGAVDLHRTTFQHTPHKSPQIEERFEIVSPSIQAGDALFFHPLVYHTSAPKLGPGRRAAWSSIWLMPHVRWAHENAPAHPLCRHVEDGALMTPYSF